MRPVIPDFFIVGGPRCGATALTSYLAEHPGVFFPGALEPHYFCPDLQLDYRVTALEDYLALFAEARDHTAVGETAGWYLHSDRAIPGILAFNPDARFVVLLRNPIELVRSLHAYNLAHAIEDEPDFEVAWSLQGARCRGRRLPRTVSEPRQLQYRWVGSLGLHLERATSIVPGEQLKVVVHDDLEAAPGRIYEELLTFLCLPSFQQPRFQRVNVSQRSRSGLLQRLLYQPPGALRLAVRATARVVGPERVYRIEDRIRRFNRRDSPPAPLSGAVRERLAAEFEDDVELQSRLVRRDLSGWLRC